MLVSRYASLLISLLMLMNGPGQASNLTESVSALNRATDAQSVSHVDNNQSKTRQKDPLTLHPVVGPIFAIVGPLGDRTPENLGNNATFGFIVGKTGVVVVDPGGTYKGAMAIHQLIQGVTDKPIKYVINTGGQDHRWLGNDYFRALGADIIASEAAVEDQKTRLNDILLRLSSTAGDPALQQTKDTYANIQFEDNYRFYLDDIEIHVVHPGAAHSPGDSYVWVPQFQTVFSGDIVYTQRLLSMMSFSNSKYWLQSYQQLAQLKAKHVVPGHGKPTTMEIAHRDTFIYLSGLRQKVGEFMNAGGDISDVGQIDQSSHKHLANFDFLKGRNVQKIYQEMEFE